LEETKKRWHEKSDSVSMWVENEVAVNPTFRCKTTVLYEYYRAWCLENGEKIVTDRMFFAKLEGLGPYRKSVAREHGKSIRIMTGAKPRKVIEEEKLKEGQKVL